MKKSYYLYFLLLFTILTNAQPCYREMHAGRNFTIALKDDNTLWAFGTDEYGQLGNGSAPYSQNATQIGTDSDWSQIAVADYSVLAIKTNGTLWAWGRNEWGQLGVGTLINVTTPTQVESSVGWQQVAIGRWSATGIKTDGTLWTWGRNQQGMLGDGTTIDRLSPVQIGSENNWFKVAMGYYHVLTIKTDGTLWSWGSNIFNQINGSQIETVSTPTQVGTDSNWSEIAAGNIHNVALKNNGTIWSWGSNQIGYLGNGSYAENFTPTQMGLSGSFLKIAVGLGHSIALKSDGTLWAWGLNNAGQVGNGTINNTGTDVTVLTPVQVGTDNNWTKIAVGSHSTFASKEDSNWAWGSNYAYILGNSLLTGNQSNPIIVNNCSILTTDETIKEGINLIAYPNPTKDFITIDSTIGLIQKIEMYNLQGRMVLAETLNETLIQHKLNISGLAKGGYLLKVTTSMGIENIKIIKE